MHPYGIDTAQRKTMIIWLIVISFLVAPIVNRSIEMIGLELSPILGYVIDVGSAGGLFYLLANWMDSAFWRLRPIRWLFGITVPNLQGKWVGQLESSYDSFQTKHEIELVIRQTWTQIVVELRRSGGSGSSSTTASILLEAGTDPQITYTYSNIPEPGQPDTMHQHLGTTVLTFHQNDILDELSGSYYTGRGRGTYGTMRLRRNPT